jgi:hypothetical protein
MHEAGLRRSTLDEADRLFDPQAKAAYRRRLRDREEDLEKARSWGDPERAARAREEMDALTDCRVNGPGHNCAPAGHAFSERQRRSGAPPNQKERP